MVKVLRVDMPLPFSNRAAVVNTRCQTIQTAKTPKQAFRQENSSLEQNPPLQKLNCFCKNPTTSARNPKKVRRSQSVPERQIKILKNSLLLYWKRVVLSPSIMIFLKIVVVYNARCLILLNLVEFKMISISWFVLFIKLLYIICEFSYDFRAVSYILCSVHKIYLNWRTGAN